MGSHGCAAVGAFLGSQALVDKGVSKYGALQQPIHLTTSVFVAGASRLTLAACLESPERPQQADDHGLIRHEVRF